MALACLAVHAGLGLSIAGRGERSEELLLAMGVSAISFLALHRWVLPLSEPLLPPVILLYAVGWTEVWRLRPDLALKQCQWLVVATVGALALQWGLTRINLLERYRNGLLACGLGLLFLALVVGPEVNGAKLWLRFGGFSFQPIEIVKIVLVISLASFWRRFRLWLRFTGDGRSDHLPRRGMAVLILGWASGLMLLVAQKDLGMALLLIGVLFTLFYVSLGQRRFVLIGISAFVVAGVAAVLVFHHIRIRIRAWWDPFRFAETDGYQMVQAIYALADGGPWGRGLFLGRPYLIPEAHNDFILIAICQELGWLAGLVVLACVAFIGYHIFCEATRCHGVFPKLLLAGLGSLWSLQCFIIIAGTTKVIPMTGLTLPFVSYGGSSLLANLVLLTLVGKCTPRGT